MSVSEIERRQLAANLAVAIGEEATETLMRCILPEGRDELATKADLQVGLAEARAERAELETKLETGLAEARAERAALESTMVAGFARLETKLARQTRIHFGTLSAFILSVWAIFVAQLFM